MTHLLRITAFAALCLTACKDETSKLTLAAVDPSTVYNGVDFPTSVYGTGMLDARKVSLANGDATVELTQFAMVDDNRVDAVVPKGTPPGTYDVVVTDKEELEATLAAALTVTADLTVSVCAVDPTFGATLEDTDVTISATADGTAGGAPCGGKSVKFASSPRAWLVIGGALRPVGNLSFVSPGLVTGTVPKGLTVGGPYDVLVQNPDGAVGLLSMGFKVVDMPVPQVTALDPPTVGTNYNAAWKIFGKNFRAPVKVELYNEATALKEVPGATVVSPTEINLTLNNQSLGLPIGAYVVRVTNTDQGTFGEYSVLAIISSSGNTVAWTNETSSTPLPNKVMRHGAGSGQVSPAARYLYVVGGDSGGATPTLYDQTQIASLDKFGNIGGWIIGHNKLPAARTMLEVVVVPAASGAGGYVYAIGGDAGAGAVTTVSRAKILLPAEAPQVTKTAVSLGGTLTRGTYYYRVSAVLDATDVANPMGETLPSEEVAAHTIDTAKVTIEWAALPRAGSYRVYRTAVVNGVSKDEVLLKDGITTTSFIDDGSIAAGTARPLAQGELGVWVAVSSMAQARRTLAAAVAHDPMGAAYLYVLGGDKGMGFANLIDSSNVHDTYEYAGLTDDGLTLGTFTEDLANKMAAKRTRLRSGVGEHGTSPAVVAPANYVYAIGGFNGSTVVNSYEQGTVQAGGALTWSTGQSATSIHQALTAIVYSNFLFVFGGTDAAGVVQVAAAERGYTAPPIFGPTLTSNPDSDSDTAGATVAAYATLSLGSAHFFLLGGTTDGMTALDRVWSQVY